MEKTTWQQDAAKVLNTLAELEAGASGSVQRRVRQFADPGNRPGPYTVLTRDALHMVMDANNDSVLWSEDREACEVAAACMNLQLPNARTERPAVTVGRSQPKESNGL